MAQLSQHLSAAGVCARSRQGEALLTDVSHDFCLGFTAVLGGNGAGKTSLLRALAGDLPVTGTITLNGQALAALKDDNRLCSHMAFLPQHSQLQFPLLVSEVVELGLYQRPLAPAQRQAMLHAVAGQFNLAALWHKPFTQLSGGEQARVHLARVYVQLMPEQSGDTQPPVRSACYLLLDEPVAALDIPHQHTVMALLANACQSTMAVVAVLHDVNLALRYASQAVLMKDSRILAAGPVVSTLTEPLLQQAFDAEIRLLTIPGEQHLTAVYG